MAVLLFLAIQGTYHKLTSVQFPAKTEVPSNAVLKLEFNQEEFDEYPKYARTNNRTFNLLKNTSRSQYSFPEQVYALKQAVNDNNIKAVYVEIKNRFWNGAQSWEIQKALVDLRKAGKPVYVYASAPLITQNEMFVISAGSYRALAPYSQLRIFKPTYGSVFLKGFYDKFNIDFIGQRMSLYKDYILPHVKYQVDEDVKSTFDSTYHMYYTLMQTIADNYGRPISDFDLSDDQLMQMYKDAKGNSAKAFVDAKWFDSALTRGELEQVLAKDLNLRFSPVDYAREAREKYEQPNTPSEKGTDGDKKGLLDKLSNFVGISADDKPTDNPTPTDKPTDNPAPTSDDKKDGDKKDDKSQASTESKEEKPAKPKLAKFISLNDYTNSLKEKLFNNKASTSAPHIAYISFVGDVEYLTKGNGVINLENSLSFLRSMYYNANNVDAIVIRVDSPGGAAITGEMIREALGDLKAKNIPIVITQGNLAASAGYMISSGSDYIFTTPQTITGSIGVVNSGFNLARFLNNFNIKSDTYGVYKEFGDNYFKAPYLPAGYSNPYADKQAAMFKNSIATRYYMFISQVYDGRKDHFKNLDEVNRVAQGHTWGGDDALKLGLVDQFGGASEAIDKARELILAKQDSRKTDEFSPGTFQVLDKEKVEKLPVIFYNGEYQTPVSSNTLLRRFIGATDVVTDGFASKVLDYANNLVAKYTTNTKTTESSARAVLDANSLPLNKLQGNNKE